ncbi:hypothetical protein QBC47DRAFT_458831 [Echria macrotheca]|uniref:Uncharacterized protein n=1 Tax=Echria macrotheca TaxID=438768 RepID=A0AAJ0BHJ1_9PEZI|nr:hypothetical protein QBC47DRAFT_458831 [Echria macrotheca]
MAPNDHEGKVMLSTESQDVGGPHLSPNPPSSGPVPRPSSPVDNCLPRSPKRQRTEEVVLDGYAEYLDHHSEDDAAALAAQLEADAFLREPEPTGDDSTGATDGPVDETTTDQEEATKAREESRQIDEPGEEVAHGGTDPSMHMDIDEPRDERNDNGDDDDEGEDDDEDDSEENGEDDGEDADNGDKDDDCASVASDVSVGFDHDFWSDLSLDFFQLLKPPPKPGALATSPPEPTFSRDETRPLRHTLAKWLRDDKKARVSNIVFFQLKHVYPEKDLSVGSLFPQDQRLVHFLVNLSKKLPVEIFLAPLDREKRPAWQNYNLQRNRPLRDPTFSSSLITRNMVDVDGRSVLSHIPVDDWLVKSYTMGRPDPGAVDPFCETAVVLVARDSIADLFTGFVGRSPQEISPLLSYYVRRCSEPTADTRLLPVLQDLCRSVCDIHSGKGLSRLPVPDVDQLFKLLIESGDLDLFDTAATYFCGNIPLEFFSWARGEIQAGGVSFYGVNDGISTAILSYPSPIDSWKGLVAFAGLASSDESMVGFPGDQEAEQWIRAHLRIILEKGISRLGPNDSMIGLMADNLPFQKLSTVLDQTIKSNASSIPFSLSILARLRDNIDKLPQDEVHQMSQMILA